MYLLPNIKEIDQNRICKSGSLGTSAVGGIGSWALAWMVGEVLAGQQPVRSVQNLNLKLYLRHKLQHNVYEIDNFDVKCTLYASAHYLLLACLRYRLSHHLIRKAAVCTPRTRQTSLSIYSAAALSLSSSIENVVA